MDFLRIPSVPEFDFVFKFWTQVDLLFGVELISSLSKSLLQKSVLRIYLILIFEDAVEGKRFFLQVIDKRTLCMQWTITSFYKLNFLNLQISKGCFLPFIVFQILKNKIKNIRLSYWKNRTDLEVGDEHICPLGVGHLDFILEVLLGGKEVPDLLVVDLKEGRLDNKMLVLT